MLNVSTVDIGQYGAHYGCEEGRQEAVLVGRGEGVDLCADAKAEIARLCTFESDTRKTELVKACKVGSTWYAAAKVTNVDGSPVEDATYVTEADGSITFGAVFLTRYDEGCWSYKDMEPSSPKSESAKNI